MGEMNEYQPPIIELSGSPYEIGVQHGRLLQKQIRSQLGLYRAMFKSNSGLEWEEVCEVAKEYHSSIHVKAPHLLEEMRGIADGMNDGTTVMDVVALNARSEIALGMWKDGCTSLGWHLKRTTNGEHAGKAHGKQILAQNWDWQRGVGVNLAIVSIKQINRPQIWMVTEPGIIGKIGFNSSSVGVCLNAIRATRVHKDLLPIHCVLRIALESTSVKNAITQIHDMGGSASCQHILIADPYGSRGLEVSPHHIGYLDEDARGMVTHTNHCLTSKDVDERPWLEGSPVRLKRVNEVCTKMVDILGLIQPAEEVTAELLRRNVFSDRFNAPQSISGGHDVTENSTALETLFNIVMVFQEGEGPRAEVTFGRPDRPSGRVFALPW